MQTATPAAEAADFGNRLSAVESRLSRVEGIVEQMDKRLTAIEQRLANLESRVESGFRWIIGIQFATLVALGTLILVKLG